MDPSATSSLRVGWGTALRVFDHARQTYGEHETRVDLIDINGEMIKEGRALKRLCITTVRALFTCPLTGLYVFYL